MRIPANPVTACPDYKTSFPGYNKARRKKRMSKVVLARAENELRKT
jgi:hypothetical protein